MGQPNRFGSLAHFTTRNITIPLDPGYTELAHRFTLVGVFLRFLDQHRLFANKSGDPVRASSGRVFVD